MNFFAAIANLNKANSCYALCTVVKTSGSVPRKAGAKMIVVAQTYDDDYGTIIGTIGGGAIEHHIRRAAIDAIRVNQPTLITTSLRNELGMCCGGEMTVFIEPISKRPAFICYGAGHIAQSLCSLIDRLGDYDIHVIDSRRELLEHPAFLTARKWTDTSVFALPDLPVAGSFIVIATHDHDLDQKIAEGIVLLPFRYAALVGSARKALMMKKRMLAKGFGEQQIARIFCPAGLAIYAHSPEEIALSIAAQMTQVKNAKYLGDDSSGRTKSAHGAIQSLHDSAQ